MPYIKDSERERVIADIRKVKFDDICRYDYAIGDKIHTTGKLNYLITFFCHKYIEYCGESYATINAVIGVLECAKLELYRMIAAKYEDKKRMENGPISDLDSHTLEDVR